MKKEDFSHIVKEAQVASLSLNEYQALAAETRLETATPLYCLLNLSGEVGELCGRIAKGIRDGVANQEEYTSLVKKELGDILWQLSQVALDNGFLLEDVAFTNLKKLKKRQQEGTLNGSGDTR